MDPNDYDDVTLRTFREETSRALIAYRDERRGLTVVVGESQYRWLCEIEQALASRTWGELAAGAPADIVLEILDFAGYGDLADDLYPHVEVGKPLRALGQVVRFWEQRSGRCAPHPAAPFDAASLDPVLGGVFPPDPWILMTEVLPPRVLHWYERTLRAVQERHVSDHDVVARLLTELVKSGAVVRNGRDPHERRSLRPAG